MAVLGFFLLFFAAFGLAWWIGELISSRIGGFLIVAGFFALLIVLLVAFKEQFLYPMIRNKIVKKVYE
jgi:membrane protein implicated in regulation of membrane protease activity